MYENATKHCGFIKLKIQIHQQHISATTQNHMVEPT